MTDLIPMREAEFASFFEREAEMISYLMNVLLLLKKPSVQVPSRLPKSGHS